MQIIPEIYESFQIGSFLNLGPNTLKLGAKIISWNSRGSSVKINSFMLSSEKIAFDEMVSGVAQIFRGITSLNSLKFFDDC